MTTAPMSPRLRGFGSSLVLYVVACATPALLFQRGAERESQWGAACLLLGALTLFTYVPAWLANLTLLVGAARLPPKDAPSGGPDGA